MSGAHTLCLFGFCPASNINLQTHYRSYCMQAICLRAGRGLKCFEMSQFTIHEFRYQNNAFFDTFIFRIHVYLQKCTSNKRRQTSVAKETLAAFALSGTATPVVSSGNYKIKVNILILKCGFTVN